jgi:Arc/MetJ-type ribon-helix-helix transcriptional regulator
MEGVLLGKECIDVGLDEGLLREIEELVEAGEFKSVDDYIELATHEYLIECTEKAADAT